MAMSSYEQIDPHGDLILVVGTAGETRLKVSRANMRLASPVWAAMVAGNFAEASTNELKLPADDPQALCLILLVSHFRISQIPPTIPLETLGEVAKICDKYDVMHWATGYLRKWAVASFPQICEPDYFWDNTKLADGNEYVKFCVAWIWIAWCTKNFDMFQGAYFLLFAKIQPSKLHGLPELPIGCADFLARHVKREIDKALDAAYNLLESCQSSTIGTCTNTTRPDVRSHCRILGIGQATQFFWQTGLPMQRSLRPDALSVAISIGSMESICDGLASARLYMDFGGTNHENCYPEFASLEMCLYVAVNEDDAGIRTEFASFFS